MRKPAVVTGLDIGSSKICAVLGEVSATGEVRIVGVERLPSQGVKRGHVVDLDLAVESVARALERLEEKSSRKAENIYASITGSTVSGQAARGMVSLALRGREITDADMKRCVNVASTIRLPFDRDILHKVVHSYLIDDETETDNPLGLYGSRLAVEVYVITAGMNHIQNIGKVVNNAGYEVKEVVYSGLADFYGFFNADENREGAAIINVGDSLTELTLFRERAIRFAEVIPFGVSDIPGDLETDPELEKTTRAIREKLETASPKGMAPRRAIVTGGGVLKDGLVERLERDLGLPLRTGTAKGLIGNVSALESMTAATAIGLVRYAFKKHAPPPPVQPKTIVRRFAAKVADIFNNYF